MSAIPILAPLFAALAFRCFVAAAEDETNQRSPDAARLQRSLADTGLGEHWIYDDIPAAMARAKESGKPVMAVFR